MNVVTPELLAQFYKQDSEDPFLMLVTLTHSSFTSPQYLVNNRVDITSRSNLYIAFPMKITLPADDGTTTRQAKITFDNVGLDLIGKLRSITTPISVKIEMVLASNPNQVQIELTDLHIRNISYNKSTISATLSMDDFLNIGMTSEQYTPQNFPGIF
jgi:hypothetical protein